MTVRTRCLATLLVGLGLGTPAWADDGWAPRKSAGDVRQASGVGDRPDVLPPVTPAADTDGRPDMLPPPAPIPPIPSARVIDVPVPPAPPAPREMACPDVPPCPTCPPKTPLELWAEVDYLQWWYRG